MLGFCGFLSSVILQPRPTLWTCSPGKGKDAICRSLCLFPRLQCYSNITINTVTLSMLTLKTKQTKPSGVYKWLMICSHLSIALMGRFGLLAIRGMVFLKRVWMVWLFKSLHFILNGMSFKVWNKLRQQVVLL